MAKSKPVPTSSLQAPHPTSSSRAVWIYDTIEVRPWFLIGLATHSISQPGIFTAQWISLMLHLNPDGISGSIVVELSVVAGPADQLREIFKPSADSIASILSFWVGPFLL